MQRIPVPVWAPPYLARGANGEALAEVSGPEGDRAAALFQPYLAQILSLVDRAVNDYVNNPDLTFSEDEGCFPCRERLNGEYYREGPRYVGEQGCYSVRVLAHCIEKQRRPAQDEFDYLGLDVLIELDPATGSLYVS
jgi:hypothetical protein